MHGPHILVLSPSALAVEVPAHQAIDIDKGVAIENDTTHRFTDCHKLTAFSITGVHLDTCNPSVGRITLDPPLPPS